MDTMNLENVASVAARECIRQHVGISRLSTLLEAYRLVYGMTRTEVMTGGAAFIANLGGVVEPDNRGKFRTSPVTFLNGGTAARSNEIERLMYNLITHGERLTPEEWTKQFLWIHPFTDGNGRTAWVLYNLLNETMADPLPLPKFF